MPRNRVKPKGRPPDVGVATYYDFDRVDRPVGPESTAILAASLDRWRSYFEGWPAGLETQRKGIISACQRHGVPVPAWLRGSHAKG